MEKDIESPAFPDLGNAGRILFWRLGLFHGKSEGIRRENQNLGLFLQILILHLVFRQLFRLDCDIMSPEKRSAAGL